MRWDPTTVEAWAATPLDHRLENMTTRDLVRHRGRWPDGRPGSVVAKTLQPASAHPAFDGIPAPFRAEVLADLHWLGEPDVYRCGLGAALPAPLRMPEVLAITDDGPDACTIWMEDVDDVTPWDLDRHRRTAEALGALCGRWTGEEATAAFGLHGRDIGNLYFGKVLHHDLLVQGDDAFWADPVLAEVVDADHRRDLLRLADAVPTLLASVDDAPLGICHGDATPDNFREPGDGSIVALDWSYGHVGHVGSDLGQLLAGRFESGAGRDDDAETVAAAILDGNLEGLARVGREVDPGAVRRSFALHLAVRSAFSGLLLEHRDGLTDDERRLLLEPRARLGRFAIDLALSQV